ncbi:phosphoglycerate mutase-like protein [Mycena pura]|uniref:Phosphoglycerate mutase-like protein n=1 Tax=Mycena pura TaxID=153505 RepID=A0AAD6YH46_9AGAR|nr:phosphoglycerate mutase-like protein [Mycena pura]
MPFVRVYLVRHGETQENRDGVFQGQLDTELNETGVRQARLVADALRSVHFDAAYSSDLRRALKTAEIILAHRSDIEIRREEALRERFLGSLQGTKVVAGRLEGLAVDATVETADAFAARAARWWTRAVLQRSRALAPRETAYTVLVASHGGVIGTLARTLVGSRMVRCAPGVQITTCRNSSVTVIDVESDGRGTIVLYGDVEHLERGLEEEMVETNADEAVVDAGDS